MDNDHQVHLYYWLNQNMKMIVWFIRLVYYKTLLIGMVSQLFPMFLNLFISSLSLLFWSGLGFDIIKPVLRTNVKWFSTVQAVVRNGAGVRYC